MVAFPLIPRFPNNIVPDDVVDIIEFPFNIRLLARNKFPLIVLFPLIIIFEFTIFTFPAVFPTIVPIVAFPLIPRFPTNPVVFVTASYD